MKELSQRHRQQVAYHRHGIHLAEAYPGPGKADPDDESEGKDGENDERVERQGAESAEGPVHGLLAVGPSLDAALQDRGEDGVDDDLGEDDCQDPRPADDGDGPLQRYGRIGEVQGGDGQEDQVHHARIGDDGPQGGCPFAHLFSIRRSILSGPTVLKVLFHRADDPSPGHSARVASCEPWPSRFPCVYRRGL